MIKAIKQFNRRKDKTHNDLSNNESEEESDDDEVTRDLQIQRFNQNKDEENLSENKTTLAADMERKGKALRKCAKTKVIDLPIL
ncbi:hypothetical protein PSTG_10004 [Puccinia striiformis f. sp. tritici PST-78]|uniref:Uncharacterized protein n=1 Tax=Puccinia striiformis f. sp. tritici PST-78 TaxID=1165861 RepID=A0A0L0VBT9_9BASI|nr:hypothetical protein PSTG_10004 [Puccinia striiformis f. sp. tritici PST-78]